MGTIEVTVTAPPTLLDLAIPVRPGDSNEELRFTLRSVEAHLPHANVWIVGHQPSWVTGVNFIPGNLHTPRSNLWHNLLAFCQHPDTPDRFVITNDDIMVTEPVPQVEVLYRGTLKDHINMRRVQRGASWWRDSLNTTLVYLQGAGHPDPLSYELHVPFLADKHLMRETLLKTADVTPHNPPQWRTLYGVLNDIGGRQSTDSKAYQPGPVRAPYHSTEDRSWRYFATQLRKAFPEPGKYEK